MEARVSSEVGAATAGVTTPQRCPHCCDHGIPRDGGHWCGWCDDILEGYDDAVIPRSEPMWLCPHGVGAKPGKA